MSYFLPYLLLGDFADDFPSLKILGMTHKFYGAECTRLTVGDGRMV